MIISGKLIACKREAKEFDKKRRTDEKLFITLAEVELTKDQMIAIQDAYKDAGAKFTPDWVKDFKGYVNLSTKFNLPVRDTEKKEHASIEDAIADGLKWLGAQVRVSINIKEGAIYPSAIVMDSEGEAPNAFGEFDD